MNALKKFRELIKHIEAPPRQNVENMVALTRSWANLHPALAEMDASELSLRKLGHMMYTELTRIEGPRHHIMDRLYKRYSNLRRIRETEAMTSLLPTEEDLETAGADQEA